jgi:hypothetical protein
MDVTLDQQDLADVRERQVLRCGNDLDGAGGDPAVAPACLGVRGWDLIPWQPI